MRRVAMQLEYDGAAYGGSQLQWNAPSIQGALEAALARLTGEAVRVAFAGRTDAGVHAMGQVAAFSTGAGYGAATFARALNALLPEDIAVRAAWEAAPDFDPRREARLRRYRYTIWNGETRSPLWRRHAWWVRPRLDTAAMAREAAALLGEHDLASFGGALPEGRGTRRRVFGTAVERQGPLVLVEIAASAFLPHQVRRTVGALVEIGSGRLGEGAFARWRDQPRAGSAGPSAPAHGLCLVSVEYGEAPPGWRDDTGAAVVSPLPLSAHDGVTE